LGGKESLKGCEEFGIGSGEGKSNGYWWWWF